MQTHLALLALAGCSCVTAASCPVADVSVIAHSGTPTGEEAIHNGVNMYIAKPEGESTGKAVLYLTDVFGIQLAENKLLADSFARAGYLTVAPDMFNGKPAPGDINVPGFNTTEFLAAHGPEATDPIIASTVAYLRDELDIKRIGATGYCFGGRYSFRMAGKNGGADATFAAHPSLLENGEIEAVGGPASVAAAETDSMMSPERRAEIEALLAKTGKAFQVALYGGTTHGFGVRANISNPEQKFGKESAFFQAVRWFDAWL